jgi:hypothetical protein
MADISKITLPTGTTYDIKDQGARDLIAEMSGYTDFLGVTTTALTDGATTNPIKINNVDVTAKKGNIVTYGSAEFIFNGTAWQAFGDLSGLGSLAYKNSASGTVAVPKTYTTTVTPVAKNVSVSGTTTGSVSVTKSKVGVHVASQIGPQPGMNYTPSGTNASSSVSGSCTVTAKGSVAAPTISVKTAGSTTTVKNPTAKTVVTDMSVAAPSGTTATGELVYCSVSGETLSLSKFIETTGDSITTANVTVKNGDAAYQASAPVFNGSSATGTISGTAAAQTFTGTAVRFETEENVATDASFTGASMTSTGSYTPAAPTATTTTATTENKTVTVS